MLLRFLASPACVSVPAWQAAAPPVMCFAPLKREDLNGVPIPHRKSGLPLRPRRTMIVNAQRIGLAEFGMLFTPSPLVRHRHAGATPVGEVHPSGDQVDQGLWTVCNLQFPDCGDGSIVAMGKAGSFLAIGQC